jgi:hypothetical protein
MMFRVWLLAVAGLLFTSVAPAAVLPAGTVMNVRLTSEVNSDKHSGEAVSGVIIAPVIANGVPVIPAGTRVTGITADAQAAQAAADGNAEKPATLRIQFTKVIDLQGHEQPLTTIVESVDNARETVDGAGLITGIKPSTSYEARIDQGISKLGNQHQALADLLSSVKGAVLKQVDPAIDYKPGVELEVKLTQALNWPWPSASKTVQSVTPAAALSNLISAVPVQTLAQSPPSPSDLTNLMFIGSAEQVQAAFQDAGWFAATARDRSSEFETARAMIESRGYSEAPVSTLYLNGKPPDMTFEKTNNTFNARHHIRVWLQSEQFEGKQVWMAAATHDTGITFSRESKNFTHAIDPQIDRERTKVANDLLFTGRVKAYTLAERSRLPKNPSNATGDKLITDGKIAVVEF